MIESSAKIKRKHLVKEQVPAFVVEEHATFVAFLEAYYEFLSEKQFVTSERLIDYLDLDNVPYEFLTYFWDEIKEIPGNIAVDKRLLSKHIRDLYASKGSRKSIQLLFRILYNEDIKIYEPKDDMLRASDGKWKDRKIIRTKVPVGTDLNSLIGKKLHQFDNFSNELSQFIVASITLVNIQGSFVHVEITPSSLIGIIYQDLPLFNSSRNISLTIVPTFNVDKYQHRGALYKSGDVFFAGDIPCYVESVGSGSIDGCFIIDGGSGYSAGDLLYVNENGTGGSDLSIFIKEVGSSGNVRELIILNNGRGYEFLPIVEGNGTGNFQLYSSSVGRVLKLNVKEPTSNNLPINVNSRCIVNSSLGFIPGENLFKLSDKITNENGIAILSENGIRIILENQSPVSSIGKVNSIESKNVLLVNYNFGSGNFLSEDGQKIFSEDLKYISTESNTVELGKYTVTGDVSGTIASILFVDPCKISTKMDSIFTISSTFVGEDGFVSQLNKRVQDSLFYQDFSYVIQSAQSFDTYKNIMYKLIHPAGLAMFGEVNINTFVSTVEDRIKKGFDDFVQFTEKVLSITTSVQDSTTRIQTQSISSLGSTYEFLDKFKFMLGSSYAADTFGTAASQLFNRETTADGDGSWKIEDFANVKFTDIYVYDSDYSYEYPLVLDGSFNLDGSQILSGNRILDISDSAGKYRPTRRRVQYTHGVELRIAPSYPIIEDLFLLDDVSFVLSARPQENVFLVDATSKTASYMFNLSDSVASVDNISPLYSFLRNPTDSLTVSESLNMTFSRYETGTLTVVDAISRVGLDAPKDSTSIIDTVTWIISSAVSINTNQLNTGTI